MHVFFTLDLDERKTGDKLGMLLKTKWKATHLTKQCVLKLDYKKLPKLYSFEKKAMDVENYDTKISISKLTS